MGYYTGTGEVTGGGSTVSVYLHYLWNGAHNVYQKKTTTVTAKHGVALATAQAAAGEVNMVTASLTNQSGVSGTFPNVKGTQTNYTYSQINGSNLYELIQTTDSIAAKYDNGSWVNP